MIKQLMRSELFLSLPAVPATHEDLAVAQDLLDTLNAHRDTCVGMSANMIGVRKAIIAFTDSDGTNRLALNPQLLKSVSTYQTEEGCLSLNGVRPCTRAKRIRLKFQDTSFAWHEEWFEGLAAQSIQHQLDHLAGIII